MYYNGYRHQVLGNEIDCLSAKIQLPHFLEKRLFEQPRMEIL